MPSSSMQLPAFESEFPRRIPHGSGGPSKAGPVKLYQPQDGANGKRRVAEMASSLSQMPEEAEDARLTGGTRSLVRRLSGLNLVRVQRPVGARSGLRSVRGFTTSFTGGTAA